MSANDDPFFIHCSSAGCDRGIDVRRVNTYWAEYRGYARKREQGGLNDLKAKKPTGRVICDISMTAILNGITPGQMSF